MTTLLISTSPRCTWVWAADAAMAAAVRKALDDRGMRWSTGRRGRDELPMVTDIDIGVDALSGCQALSEAGFTLAWHPDQHPLNRTPDLYGIPVGSAPGESRPTR